MPISPHIKRYMDSKEKGMNGYTILSSHRERNRIKEDKGEIGMNNIFVLGDRMESSSIYIIYII